MTLARPELSLRHYAGEYAVHAHAHAQVLLGRQGRLELEVDGRAAFVDASCGLVIPAGAAHAFMCRAPAQVLVVDAPAETGLQRIRRFALASLQWPAALGRLDTAADRGGGARSGAVRDNACSGDATQLLRQALLAPRVHGNRRALAPETLEAALDAALFEDWSTARMAALFCLSPQRFHARWLAQTGETPQAGLRRRRLVRATALLQGGMGLEAAALQVGYGSASALAFALRREQGTGARGLRRRTVQG